MSWEKELPLHWWCWDCGVARESTWRLTNTFSRNSASPETTMSIYHHFWNFSETEVALKTFMFVHSLSFWNIFLCCVSQAPNYYLWSKFPKPGNSTGNKSDMLTYRTGGDAEAFRGQRTHRGNCVIFRRPVRIHITSALVSESGKWHDKTLWKPGRGFQSFDFMFRLGRCCVDIYRSVVEDPGPNGGF